MLQVLDADAVRRWCTDSAAALGAARAEIDELNVYPVPDGDTGTNLWKTMEAAEQAVRAAPADMAATAGALAHGALMGARGNSGVILSQLLRGLAEVLVSAETCAARELQRGLTRAAELCYAAVATPVEGTLLTVARECAEAVELRVARGDADLAAVVREARSAAGRSLARTPDLLPALQAAGVVDAGGRGLCVLLESLERVVTGELSRPDPQPADQPQLHVPRDPAVLAAAREQGSDAFGYEVQYLLRDADDAAVEQLKQVLGELGDSLVVVGMRQADGGSLHNVHVHVNDIGAALEAGVESGRPFRISVTRFADSAAVSPPVMNERPVGRGVVAVAPGSGLAALFEQSGAAVVEGGPTSNPSTAELLEVMRARRASELVVLPNDSNVAAVAGAAAAQAREEGLSVAVVPTRSVLQGLAALAVADATRSFADDVAAMAEAAGSTRWAEVTVAVREAATWAGICHPGDVLGLLEGDVVLIGPAGEKGVEQVARELLERMLGGGGELVTVVTGADAAEGVGERLASYVEKAHPAVEVVGYEGGQPHYPLLLAVE